MTAAIGLTAYGPASVLRPVEIPDRHAGPGEVRIQVRAAAVNPVDAIIRSGGFAGNNDAISDPVIPGTDVSGVLDEIGPDQPAGFDLAVGDAVCGFVVPSGSHGGYSARIVLPSESVTRMPTGDDYASGASFLSNALTAAIALEALDLPTGATLAVTGATGAVGGYLIQLAAQRKLRVIAAARPDEADTVRQLGADIVLNRDADFALGVLKATGGHGADAVADPAILADTVTPAVRDGGQIAFFLPNDVDPGRDIHVFRSYVMRSSRRHDAIETLAQNVAAGQLRTTVAGTMPAADAVLAHQRMEAGGLRGRLILTF